MRNTLYDAILLGLVLLCVGGYFFYRDSQANKLSHIESFTALKIAPATKCSLKSGNFEGSSVGSLSVHKGRALFNILVTGLVRGFEGRLHVLIQPDGTLVIYPETAEALPKGMNTQERVNLINEIISSYTWNCSPWWIPNDAVFNISK